MKNIMRFKFVKRIILLSCVFIFSIANFIFASTYDISQINQVKAITEYSIDTKIEQMDTVTFGSYPQSDASGNAKDPIEWLVLEKKGNNALLISKNILDRKQFNNISKEIEWKDSSLRLWLNNNFYNDAFNSDEKSYIISTSITNDAFNVNGSAKKSSTNDKIFLLSSDEESKYLNHNSRANENNSNQADIKKAMEDLKNGSLKLYEGEDDYWTRTTLLNGIGAWTSGPSVDYSLHDVTDVFGVRPAIWVSIKALTNNETVTSYDNETIGVDINTTDVLDPNEFPEVSEYEDLIREAGIEVINVSNNQSNTSKSNNNHLANNNQIPDYVKNYVKEKYEHYEPGHFDDITKIDQTGNLWIGDMLGTDEIVSIKIFDIKSLMEEEYGWSDVSEPRVTSSQYEFYMDDGQWYWDYNEVGEKELKEREWLKIKGQFISMQDHYNEFYGSIQIDVTQQKDTETIKDDLNNSGTPFNTFNSDYSSQIQSAKLISEYTDDSLSDKTQSAQSSSLNSILGDNVHVEGIDVFQNPDGTIQIGGTPKEGSSILQSVSNSDYIGEKEYLNKKIIYNSDSSIIDNKDILKVSPVNNNSIKFLLTEEGYKKYKELTQQNLGRYVYVVYSDIVIDEIPIDKEFDKRDQVICNIANKSLRDKIVNDIKKDNVKVNFIDDFLINGIEENDKNTDTYYRDYLLLLNNDASGSLTGNDRENKFENGQVIVTSDEIYSVFYVDDGDNTRIVVNFNDEGSKKIKEASKRNLGKYVWVVAGDYWVAVKVEKEVNDGVATVYLPSTYRNYWTRSAVESVDNKNTYAYIVENAEKEVYNSFSMTMTENDNDKITYQRDNYIILKKSDVKKLQYQKKKDGFLGLFGNVHYYVNIELKNDVKAKFKEITTNNINSIVNIIKDNGVLISYATIKSAISNGKFNIESNSLQKVKDIFNELKNADDYYFILSKNIGYTVEIGREAIKKAGYNLTEYNADSFYIIGLPSVESEFRDNYFYLNDNLQKRTWVYYLRYYYHVDDKGNIEKSKWIEGRYVGEDGKMYTSRRTPDGKWVGEDGLEVGDVGQDLENSLLVKEAQGDSWYKTELGLWYYFENDRTTTKKGWFLDTRDDQWYYLDPNTGIMAVGWTNINGALYYFNELPSRETNWYEVGDGFYESYGKKIKALGSMYKNETTPDGKKVDVNGKLIK